MCLVIFRPDFLYVDPVRALDDELRCPNCGDYAMDLGYAPSVTMRGEGLWYLCDHENILGPYASEEEANKDLWSWFGGKPHAKEGREEEGRQGAQGEGPGQVCPH